MWYTLYSFMEYMSIAQKIRDLISLELNYALHTFLSIIVYLERFFFFFKNYEYRICLFWHVFLISISISFSIAYMLCIVEKVNNKRPPYLLVVSVSVFSSVSLAYDRFGYNTQSHCPCQYNFIMIHYHAPELQRKANLTVVEILKNAFYK